MNDIEEKLVKDDDEPPSRFRNLLARWINMFRMKNGANQNELPNKFILIFRSWVFGMDTSTKKNAGMCQGGNLSVGQYCVYRKHCFALGTFEIYSYK